MKKSLPIFAGEWHVEAKSDFNPVNAGSYTVELTQEDDKIYGKGIFPKQSVYRRDYECEISGSIDENQAKLELHWNNQGGIAQVTIVLREDGSGFEGRYHNPTDEGVFLGYRNRDD